MADTAVSALTAATLPLANADILPILQGTGAGASKRTTLADVRRFTNMSSTPQVNDYLHMAAGGTATATALSGGSWRGGPILLPLGFTWDRIRLNVDTAGTAGCTARVVLFNDHSTPGRPGVVLLDSSNFAADAAAAVTLTGLTVTPLTPVVWAGVVVNGSPATGPRFAYRTTSLEDFVWPSEDSSGPSAYYSGTQFQWGITMSGAAADNPTMTAQSINGVIRLSFRRSA